MFGSRPKVNEVFSPRRPEVNPKIYISRESLERELKRAIEGGLHTILFGESGSGKSWLYRRVLGDLKAYVATANCANALRFGSLTEEIAHVAGLERPKRLESMEEGMHADANAVFASGGLSSQRTYRFAQNDPLLDCFAAVRDKAGDRLAVLVIDNLEMIFKNTELMNELAAVITVLDDPRYAAHQIKLLIVGVPAEIKEYFMQAQQSVANRLGEVSEVAALSSDQVASLVHRGFVELLKAEISDEDLKAWKQHIYYVTMGYAQPVQEYCEQLGYILEDAGWKGNASLLDAADNQWLRQGLTQASTVVASWMNERETKVGRRNQVLYVLGKVPSRIFAISEIERLVRVEFPESTEGTSLAIGQMLSELATQKDGEQEPMIKRSAKGANYEFRNARSRWLCVHC